MRINIIVPNFDSSSKEVVLSTWYKKVGDRILKNEKIADAETSQIACGITSAYDCILARVLVQEGEIIQQGTKIAIIETDFNSDMSDIREIVQCEETKKESEISGSFFMKESEFQETIGYIPDRARKPVISEHLVAKERRDDDNGTQEETNTTDRVLDWAADRIVDRSVDRAADRVSTMDRAAMWMDGDQNSQNRERSVENNLNGSVGLNGHGGSKINHNDFPFFLTSEEATSDSKKHEDDISYIFNVVEAEKLVEDIGGAAGKIHVDEEKVIVDFNEESGKTVVSILKYAEEQAKEEARKIKVRIIEDATRQALQQSEEIKKRILREYEEKAAKDASEMHMKIVQGSITEAENTKSKLLSEAKLKAQQEARELGKDILKSAEASAKRKAKEIEEEAKKKAKKIEEDVMEKAKNESEKISQKIIEKSIKEANDESKFIKKDIIHSANKHAVKKSQNIIRESLKRAKAESEALTKTIVQDTMKTALEDVDAMKTAALEEMTLEVRSIVTKSISEITQQMNSEIRNGINSYVKDMTFDIHREMKKDITFSVQKLVSHVNNQIQEIVQNMLRKISYETNHKIKSSMTDIVKNIVYNENESIKQEMQTLARQMSDSVNDELKDSINFVLKKAAQHEKKENQNELNSLLGSFSSEIQKEIREKVDEIRMPINNAHPCQIESGIKELAGKIVKEEVNALKEKQLTNMLINNSLRNGNGGLPHDQRANLFLPLEDGNTSIDFLKQRINDKLKSSIESSVISTVSNEVDMSGVLSLEKVIGEEFSKKYNTTIGITSFFVLGSIFALKEYRIFNAHMNQNDIIYKNTFDISVITCSSTGLIAPVIRNANMLSISEVEKNMTTLSRKALDGTLSIDEVSDGTFTVVNAGVYGSLMGTDLLTPPQVATLSVHRMHNRPVTTNTGVEIRPMLYISLSYDHRIADTKQASEFLEKVKTYVENPGWALLGIA